jgi:hypothetical protein
MHTTNIPYYNYQNNEANPKLLTPHTITFAAM